MKTLKELRETRLDIDYPKLNNLSETIDPMKYYQHIDKKLNIRWSEVDEQIEWLEYILINTKDKVIVNNIRQRIKELEDKK